MLSRPLFKWDTREATEYLPFAYEHATDISTLATIDSAAFLGTLAVPEYFMQLQLP